MMGLLNKEIIKNMKGRDMITLLDYSVEEIEALLDYAIEIKALNKSRRLPAGT